MKRLIGVIITILVMYAIYNDLSHGSLPSKIKENEAVTVSTPPTSLEAPYFEEVIKPGDTVISIIEKNLNDPIPVSISTLVSDFQKLNEGRKPEEIQIGKRYKFPTYQESE
jgi:hypothetical protein